MLLLDAGDMFQGTLESNLNEGASVIAAYNTLGYTAAAVGNHDSTLARRGRRQRRSPRATIRAAR